MRAEISASWQQWLIIGWRYTLAIDGQNRRWIDTDTIDRYYRSILLVMLTTDSIDPSVKNFFFLIYSIDHQSQNPCLTDDHRSIGSLSTDGIDPLVTIFLNEREPRKNSLQQ